MLNHVAFSGRPKDGTYSQTLISGDLFIVLSLSGPEVDLELGRNTISKIEEMIAQTPEILPKDIVGLLAEEFKNGIILNLIVVKINGEKLWLAKTGAVSAKLWRQEKIINFQHSFLSGTVLHNDFLVLGTEEFFKNISSPSFENRDQILTQVESLDDSSSLAAIFLKISLQDQPVILPPSRHFPNLKRPFDPNAQTPARKKIFYLSLIILVFLVSLITFQLRSRVLEQREKATQNITRQVQDGLDSAQKLVGLNDQIARDILLQTRQDFLTSSQQSFGKDISPKLVTLLANLDKQISLVSHINNVSNLDLFYDFSFLKTQAQVTSVALHKGEAVILDGQNGTIYSLNLSTKNASLVLGSDDFKKGKFNDSNGKDNYVWTPDGIFSPKLLIKSSDKWGDIKDLKTFAGNIYLLDSANNQIWKYQNTELGFLDISSYLRAGGVDFSNAIAMAIDGSTYVLTSTGNIAKFTSGLSETFKITGVDPAINNPVTFFTSDDINNVYILDSGGKRVVVLNKKGVYQAQYILPSTQNPASPAGGLEPRTFVLADENLKKIFVIFGSKVYSFGF